MAQKFFNLVFYRAAAAIVTTATKGGTYPAYTVSGWTAIVGAIADKASLGLDADGKDAMGDGTEMVASEAVPIEIIVKNFTGANFATLRAAMLNTKLDFLFMDADQPAEAYAAFGIRAYPAPKLSSGESPAITITGTRKVGAGVTNTPFQFITVS